MQICKWHIVKEELSSHIEVLNSDAVPKLKMIIQLMLDMVYNGI